MTPRDGFRLGVSMRYVRVRLFGALVTMALGLVSSTASAQMFVATGRDTLRGLPGLEVVVEELPPEVRRAGLSADAVRGEVQRRLAANGVTLYTTQQQNASPAKPYLYLHLNALELPGSVLVIAVQLQLRQTVTSVVTASSIVNAMTWDSHNVFALTGREAAPLTAALLEMVDGFAADWRATR
jgi:hypothetical protein